MNKTNVYVTVELVVDMGSAWGLEHTLAQVTKQATEEAKDVVQRVLRGEAFKGDQNRIGIQNVRIHNIRIFGEGDD